MVSPAKYYLLLLLALTLFASGCISRTPEPVYYTLTPSEGASKGIKAPRQGGLAVGIGPIKFPSELNRSSVVTRSGQSRLIIDEFHRWGGSLEKDFLRVMADNLVHLLKTDKVMIRPWERYFQPDVHIALDVHQFDGRLGEYASLKVTWVVYKKNETKEVVVHQSDLKEPVAEGGYDALVEAQSRLVARLSEEIAEILIKFVQ